MSKRFGRNQRRRMREQLASTELALSNAQWAHRTCMALREQEIQIHKETRRELEEAKEMAHSLSILFPSKEWRFDDPELKLALQAGAPISVDTPPSETAYIGDGMPLMAAYLSRVSLPVLLTRVQPDILAQRVHVRVAFNDNSGDTAYAINHREFLQYPRKVMEHRVCEHIAPQIARHLINQFYKKGS